MSFTAVSYPLNSVVSVVLQNLKNNLNRGRGVYGELLDIRVMSSLF